VTGDGYRETTVEKENEDEKAGRKMFRHDKEITDETSSDLKTLGSSLLYIKDIYPPTSLSHKYVSQLNPHAEIIFRLFA